MSHDSLEDAFSRLEVYEVLLEEQRAAGESTGELFDEPIAVNLSLLHDYFADPVIAGQLQDHLARYEAEHESLDPEQLAELGTSSLHRLAVLYQGSGRLSVREATGAEDGKAAAEAFLTRDAKKVAAELIGMQLAIGEAVATITDTRAQDREQNERYLASRPLFGANRSDAYLAAVRQGFMLFVKAGSSKKADSCVAIMGIELADGSTFDKPLAAAKALGFDRSQGWDKEMIGS